MYVQPTVTTQRSLLTNWRFVVPWMGQWLSEFGDRIYVTALVAQIYLTTRSVLDVSAMLIFAGIASLALSPLAGLLVDRISARTALIVSNLLSGAVVGGLVLFQGMWQIYVIVFALSAIDRVFTVAWLTAIAGLVPQSEILQANALTTTTRRIAQIAGPILAGILLGITQPRTAFVVNALSFVIAALAALAIPRQRLVLDGSASTNRQPNRLSWSYIQARPYLGSLVLVILFVSFAIGVNNSIIVAYAYQTLGVGATAFGLLISGLGVGLLLGAVLLPILQRTRLRPSLLLLSLLIMGVSFFCLSQTTNFIAALALRVTMGIGVSGYSILTTTAFQTSSPPDLRGQVLAVMTTVNDLALLVALGISGLLAAIIGIRATLACAGILVCVAMVTASSGVLPCLRKRGG